MEKTDWYPEDSRPYRVGIYETKAPLFKYEEGWMAYWDGQFWHAGCNRLYGKWYEQALINDIAKAQNRPWRGLTTESVATP